MTHGQLEFQAPFRCCCLGHCSFVAQSFARTRRHTRNCVSCDADATLHSTSTQHMIYTETFKQEDQN